MFGLLLVAVENNVVDNRALSLACLVCQTFLWLKSAVTVYPWSCHLHGLGAAAAFVVLAQLCAESGSTVCILLLLLLMQQRVSLRLVD